MSNVTGAPPVSTGITNPRMNLAPGVPASNHGEDSTDSSGHTSKSHLASPNQTLAASRELNWNSWPTIGLEGTNGNTVFTSEVVVTAENVFDPPASEISFSRAELPAVSTGTSRDRRYLACAVPRS